jgi:uncharacterized protein
MSRIAITGATGLIGSALASSLEGDGHTVLPISRSPDAAGADGVVWDPREGTIDANKLEGVDAVVHLAGEPIGDSRWTEETKRRIRRSRELGTALIAETVANLDQPPSVLVSGSATGFYGDRGEELVTEDAGPGDDFVAEVCQVWEAAAEPARNAGIRVVHNRTGVVIAPGGPLLDKLELPFKLGVGGKVGSGRQYVPWVSLEDEVRALRFLIDHDLEGPVNIAGPVAVTNAQMSKTLGKVLRRPTVMPIPVFAIRLMYGEMGVSLATVSQRVVADKLQQAGFEFRHHTIEEALRVALDRPAAA